MRLSRRVGGFVPLTAAEGRLAIKGLSLAEARRIYQALYIDDRNLAAIEDALLREQVFDAVVLHGRGAVRWLQKAVVGKRDAILGPETARMVVFSNAHRIGLLFAAERARFIGRLLQRRPDQVVFARGSAAASMIRCPVRVRDCLASSKS